MGMSIDEAIENNKNLRMYMEITDKESEYKFLKENYEALDTLIDIAHKYQKIEQIVQACGADYNSMDSYDCVEEIARILTHGNDD